MWIIDVEKGRLRPMEENQKALKAAVRQKCLELRRALGEENRKHKSLRIRQNFLALPEFLQAQTVMLFLNFQDEVETTALAEAVLTGGKKLVLPRCAPGRVLLPLVVRDVELDTEPGMWGIREPRAALDEVDPFEIDLLAVPGVAFDMEGGRLGYGGGYYDRFLQRLSSLTPRAALAFACQVVERVPVEEGDQRVDMLVTEDGVYRFSRGFK